MTRWHVSGPVKFGIDLCHDCSLPLIEMSQLATASLRRRPMEPRDIDDIPLDNTF